MDQRSPYCFSLLWRVIPCKGCRSICSLITSPAACVGSSRPSSRASSGSSPVGQELGVLYHCRGGSVSKRIDVSRQSIYKVHLQPSYPSVFLTSCQVEGRRWWTWVVSWADILPGVVGWRAWAYRSLTVSGKIYAAITCENCSKEISRKNAQAKHQARNHWGFLHRQYFLF